MTRTLSDILFDLRYVARTIASQPSFALTVPLTLALGLGLNAAGNLTEGLKDGDRTTTGCARRQRARQVLTVVEIALALTLLVAASLTLSGGARMIAAPGGFDSRSLLTLNIPLPEGRYRDGAARREFSSTLLAKC